MLRMHRDGLIRLPAPQGACYNGRRRRRRTPQAEPQLPITGSDAGTARMVSAPGHRAIAPSCTPSSTTSASSTPPTSLPMNSTTKPRQPAPLAFAAGGYQHHRLARAGNPAWHGLETAAGWKHDGDRPRLSVLVDGKAGYRLEMRPLRSIGAFKVDDPSRDGPSVSSSLP